MESLVVDLVTYARIGSTGAAMTAVDLNDTVAEALEELQPQLSEAMGIVDVGKLGTVEGDPTLLRQLFVNLIGNAIKFHRPGVAPVIGIEGTERRDGKVEVRVVDNGCGFEPEYAERIFRIFERLAPEAAPGTGVGLALCRKIVGMHFGAIVATSAVGSGATFTVTLPVSQPQELLHAL
jgi:signal transduction histidine kinase